MTPPPFLPQGDKGRDKDLFWGEQKAEKRGCREDSSRNKGGSYFPPICLDQEAGEGGQQ